MNMLRKQTYRISTERMAVLHINPGGVQYISRRFSGQDRLAVTSDHSEEVCAAVIGTAVVRHTKIISELAQSGAFDFDAVGELGKGGRVR
jgi:hypothetical protein